MTETKKDVKRNLEYTLKYVESSIKNGINGLTERMAKLNKDIQYISEDKSYDYDKRVYNMIHEIQWTLANMSFEGLAERAAEYKSIKGQIEIIKEFESAE